MNAHHDLLTFNQGGWSTWRQWYWNNVLMIVISLWWPGIWVWQELASADYHSTLTSKCAKPSWHDLPDMPLFWWRFVHYLQSVLSPNTGICTHLAIQFYKPPCCLTGILPVGFSHGLSFEAASFKQMPSSCRHLYVLQRYAIDQIMMRLL